MLEWTSDDTRQRLLRIREHVRGLWKRYTEPPWYTLHGPTHSGKVEEALGTLIPSDREERLEEKEWFCLVAAAWLHDVGMMLNLFGSRENSTQIRDDHHERSAAYVEKKGGEFGLGSTEQQVIADICRYHTRQLDIANLDEKFGGYRQRLLAAYIRLADAIQIDPTRATDSRYDLLVAAGMPPESRFHWLKNRLVHSVSPNFEDLALRVSMLDVPDTSPKSGLLPGLVADEIAEELALVRDVLIRGGVSYFLKVEPEVSRKRLTEEVEVELEELLTKVELQNLASASYVANSIINTALRLAAGGADAYDDMRNYLDVLKRVLEARPCHNVIRWVVRTIGDATHEQTLSLEERKTQVDRIKAELQSFKKTRARNVDDVASNARPLLLDIGRILLFGFSSIVLKALRDLPDQVKKATRIFVAECRGKTQYNYANEVVYCDGLKYAEAVRKAKFDYVTIVPDMCVGTLFNTRLVDKVVFGANGIDLKKRLLGHSAGHLSIARLARDHDVPVYVLADTAKFGELKWEYKLQRDIQWLGRDRRTLQTLSDNDIECFNPREDIIDLDMVDLIVTELGAFSPRHVPEALLKRFSDA